MDINLDNLPPVIYAFFVLHNYCELKNEKISEEQLKTAIHYDREFQPAGETNSYRTDSNEAEGKRTRRIITKFLDHTHIKYLVCKQGIELHPSNEQKSSKHLEH